MCAHICVCASACRGERETVTFKETFFCLMCAHKFIINTCMFVEIFDALII